MPSRPGVFGPRPPSRRGTGETSLSATIGDLKGLSDSESTFVLDLIGSFEGIHGYSEDARD
jgi:hypothetical protein